MRFVFFYHSLLSDWNHGNAHFLRGLVTELLHLGHSIEVYEPQDGWSSSQLIQLEGNQALDRFHEAYPQLHSQLYAADSFDLEDALDGADVVIVHEWNDPALIGRIGSCRRRSNFRLLFHDTHHRAVSAPEELLRFDLSGYDGVLAFGEVLRRIYLDRGWASRAWTWHEAADTRVFRPRADIERARDLVWVGNWGDGERAGELREFLIEPVARLGLRARIHGVRFPPQALSEINRANIEYAGWLANFEVPRAFAEASMTVHVPRSFYRTRLPGIPTIRVFEALACGIPLVCAAWEDAEHLFEPGADYLVARDGTHMQEHMQLLRADPEFALALGRRGREAVLARHTCAHRARELLGICAELGVEDQPRDAPSGRTASDFPSTATAR